MSRVTTHHVNVGDANDEGVLNTTFTNWNTQTAAVNEENLRTEAVDRVNIDFATDIHHKAQQSTFAGPTQITDTSYANSPTSVTSSVQLTYGMGNHAYQSIVVRCSFEVDTTGIAASEYYGVEARLLESDGGLSWSAISGTERALKSAIGGRNLRGNIFLIGQVSSALIDRVGVEFIRLTTGGSPGNETLVQNVVLSVDGYS
tara:strand:- start:510 stop:1115 length:606 start_codon:yes stop_codon:yes gene_type:complete